MATLSSISTERALAARYQSVRARSLDIAAPLSDADATLQPMPDASPAKWHLAHTSWFFETFILRDHLHGYRVYDPRWAYLFNSYYEGEGDRHPRDRRGMLSRPALDEVRAYRSHVDAGMRTALAQLPGDILELVALGLQHEEQHQELMLMDMLATLAANPLRPAAWPTPPRAPPANVPSLGWVEGRIGIIEIGAPEGDFSFDCERPLHPVLLHPHKLADRLVTNEEWLGFIADGGYVRPELWLSDGWAWVRSQHITAPLYWQCDGGAWTRFGLDGEQRIDPADPVCHVSFYEADAFARWSHARLPTEAEWEAYAQGENPNAGHQLDEAGPVRPSADGAWFGDVWQWTMSAYLPHPGFTPAAGTVGEYNGKFMSGQMVLKGASCATPRGHSRASYRNFFYPHQRWQFAGLRLAQDGA